MLRDLLPRPADRKMGSANDSAAQQATAGSRAVIEEPEKRRVRNWARFVSLPFAGASILVRELRILGVFLLPIIMFLI